jgi:hypothetical protein
VVKASSSAAGRRGPGRRFEAQLPRRPDDIAALEADLASVRAKPKRLANAVALPDDVPEADRRGRV